MRKKLAKQGERCCLLNHPIGVKKKENKMKHLLILIFMSGSLFAENFIYPKETNIEIEVPGVNYNIKEICYKGVVYFYINAGNRGYMSPVYDRKTKQITLCKDE